MFFDRTRYTATKVSSSVFNVTLVPGYEALPEEATRASLFIRDSAGAEAHIDGYRSGNQIIVNSVYSSTLPNNAMPNFGAGLEIYGTVGASILNNQLGRGAVLIMGQSNGVGYEGDTVGPLDWTDSRILQWSGSENAAILAADPLEHPDVNQRAGSVGMSMTFAKDLLRNEVHNQIVIIPHCEGSTGFWEGQWVQGGYLYNGALAKVNAFLAENPYNYLIAIVWTLGEDDAVAADRAAAFQSSFDLATTNFRSDIVGNFRQPDASRVPVICTQMSPGWNINSSVPIVRAALADTPNRLPYSAHVDSAGATYMDEFSNVHFDSAGIRLMGSRLYPGLLAARGNTNTGVGGEDGVVNETLEDAVGVASGTITTNITGTVNETLEDATGVVSGTVEGTGPIGVVNETLEDAVGVASGSFTSNSTGSVNETLEGASGVASGTIPAPIAVEFNRGVGQTTGATVTWANQGALGSGYDAVQGTSANQPTFDGSGNVVFDGSDDYLTLPGDLLSNPGGYSIMVRFKKNSGNFQSLVASDADITSRLYFITAPLSATSNDSPVLNSSSSPVAGQWHKAYITVDSNNVQTMYLDGIQVGSTTGGTKATTNTTTYIGCQEGVIWPLNGSISDLIIQPAAMTLAQMNEATLGW